MGDENVMLDEASTEAAARRLTNSMGMTLVEFVTRFYAPALTEHQLDLLRRIDQDRVVEAELALQQKRLALANFRRMTPIPLPWQIVFGAFDEASEVPDAAWARAAVEPQAEINARRSAAIAATPRLAPEIHCTECGWEGRYDDMIDGPPADPTAYRCPRCDRQSDDCMADGAYPGAISAPGALDVAIAASSSIDQAAPAAKDLRVETPEEKEVERKRLADFFAKNGML